ncbi:hypothetical protein [Alcanivorax sp. 1008]|uniref:hypothetical protein n=1 Tax=Alcanivorax sp. 1008 TaxID=2816853 RepID=UPI001D97C332|nr:hypothetical protein [Alcanivorax sp. 1008]MCC1496842.1 hypothetical protein [Alcanivorax sp. 1008]
MTHSSLSHDAEMIRTAATLYSVLESMRSLHGERWTAMVEKHGETLRGLAAHHDGNVMAAAINAARLPQLAGDPVARMVLLAVAVELVEAEGGLSCA